MPASPAVRSDRGRALAGNRLVVATDAQLHEPAGMAATPDGGFLIADVLNNEVRKMSAD